VTYFAHARTALKYGLMKLGFRKGDRILVPDYICEVLLHPLKELSLEVVYYPVDDSFEPQWDALELMACKVMCRAIVMVHYFGQPQDIGRYREFCAAHGLLLIEDNAHGFGGMIHGKLLGTFGDLGISSPRKILDTASGGILYFKGEEQLPPFLPERHLGCGEQWLRKAFGKWPRFKVCALLVAQKLPNFDDPLAFRELLEEDAMADKDSTKIISAVVACQSLQKRARRRRERWSVWQGMATDLGLRPVYDEVHPESSPWAFPAYVESAKQRDRLVVAGLKRGLVFFPWPTLPTEIVRWQGRPVSRWHNLVCVPLHQDPFGFFTT
jgi:dTDP-4-amino-4,6-dideoxygalactose transaminase